MITFPQAVFATDFCQFRSLFQGAFYVINYPRRLTIITLLTTYKSFIRPHLNYGDIIYDQAYNTSFHQKLELLQYNACLAITGAIRGTSREKLYEELGLESLQLRRWFRKLSFFYKLFNSEHPNYLFKLIPLRSSNYVTRNIHNIPLLKTRHTFFKKLFLPINYS